MPPMYFVLPFYALINVYFSFAFIKKIILFYIIFQWEKPEILTKNEIIRESGLEEWGVLQTRKKLYKK